MCIFKCCTIFHLDWWNLADQLPVGPEVDIMKYWGKFMAVPVTVFVDIISRVELFIIGLLHCFFSFFQKYS